MSAHPKAPGRGRPHREPPPATMPRPEPPALPESEDPDEWIDYQSEESFPASDPPAHGGARGRAGEPDQGGGHVA